MPSTPLPSLSEVIIQRPLSNVESSWLTKNGFIIEAIGATDYLIKIPRSIEKTLVGAQMIGDVVQKKWKDKIIFECSSSNLREYNGNSYFTVNYFTQHYLLKMSQL